MKISVITAVYNNRETIENSLLSVLGQEGAEVEHIVIDGASTDGTLDILNKYRDRLAALVSGKDGGIYHALNKGLALATGEAVGIMHSDDIYAGPEVLRKVSAFLEEKKTDAVYGDLVYTKKNGGLLRYWKAGEYDAARLRNGWMPPHPAFFARRSVYEKYGPFNTEFRIAADYELMTRFLFKYGITAAYLPEVLVKMRVGGKSNRNLANIIAKSGEDYRIIKLHGLGGLGTLFLKNAGKLHQFFVSG
ncbi:MAG: glycosyltransferase [Elusimicrobia bacterium]|nr:glycosyltransferase [Elusimicrobiota bacterium]